MFDLQDLGDLFGDASLHTAYRLAWMRRRETGSDDVELLRDALRMQGFAVDDPTWPDSSAQRALERAWARGHRPARAAASAAWRSVL